MPSFTLLFVPAGLGRLGQTEEVQNDSFGQIYL